jgi:hypothetical protein
MDDGKVKFALTKAAGGAFRAVGLGVPIVEESTSLRELRGRLQVAVRRHFGRNHLLTLLIGVRVPSAIEPGEPRSSTAIAATVLYTFADAVEVCGATAVTLV